MSELPLESSNVDKVSLLSAIPSTVGEAASSSSLGTESVVTGPHADAFRRLCRSAPWKYRSLRFTLESSVPQWAYATGRFRAPDALLLEDESGQPRYVKIMNQLVDEHHYVSATKDSWLLPATLVNPVYFDDGLVTRRPEFACPLPPVPEVPLLEMFDPVSLAGNAPAANFLEETATIHALSLAQQGGRDVVEAILTPNSSYFRSKSIHELLLTGTSWVRVDVATGVMVGLVRSDGLRVALRLDAVDEDYTDDVFELHAAGLKDISRERTFG